MKQTHTPHRLGRRLRGSALTVAVVVAVLLLNVALSIPVYNGYALVDETTHKYAGDPTQADMSMYTVTDAFLSLIGENVIPMVDEVNADRAERGEDPIKVDIIFCDDRDHVDAATASRYILYTAQHLRNAYPDHFRVSFVNVEKNPSAVQQYKVTTSSQIYSSNVIISFGTESKVYAQRGFFIANDTSSEPWAYNGEKTFANAIMAVTRAEAPVACFITNHGERVADCTSFRELVGNAGYIVQDIDLERDPIPENCRILICYDPQQDFYAFGHLGETGISEIQKLDDYLDNAYSFLLFVDNETPVLPNLEEYMEEWGVSIARGKTEDGVTENYHINDPTYRLDADGYHPLGQYTTVGPGASITKDMRSVAYPAKVVFPNATAIQMSSSYTDRYETSSDTGEAYHYGTYYRNSISRNFADIFTASQDAVANVGGETYEISTVNHPFRLMTMTSEERTVQETNYLTSTDRSYVCVFASTEVASNDALDSPAYGNANVLLAALDTMGREVVPADLTFKAFVDKTVNEDVLKSTNVIAPTVCLAVIPALLCFGAGVFVQVKRKYK